MLAAFREKNKTIPEPIGNQKIWCKPDKDMPRDPIPMLRYRQRKSPECFHLLAGSEKAKNCKILRYLLTYLGKQVSH